ncbi:TPA: DNA helicase [Trebouxia sp. C0004]
MMASSTGTTALALGPGANAIHSLAGVGRGHGSAEKVPRSNQRAIAGGQSKGSSLPFGGVRLMLVGDVAELPPVGDFTVELGDDGEQEKHIQDHLDRVPTPEHAYYAVDRHGRNIAADEVRGGNAQGPMFTDEKDQQRPILGSMSEPAMLRLRVGARVLSTGKVHDRIRTGALGVVVSFDDGMLDVVEFEDADGNPVLVTVRPKQVDVQDSMNTTLCSRTQVLLVLSYFITLHRSQGLTLPAVIMHVSKLFAYGQLYTGLSRVGDFDKLRVTSALSYAMNSASKLCDKRIRNFELDTV